MQKVVIIGAGGFGREVLDVFDAINEVQPTYEICGYIVESQYGEPGTLINDRPILGDLNWFTEDRIRNILAICAIGAPEVRYRLILTAQSMGINFCTLIHPTVVRTRWVNIGKGSIITAGCILTNQIGIGDHVHINLACTVGHDVTISDFVTLAPGVHVSGNVQLREGCYVGTGANLLEKKVVGAWSVVGAGSTIVSDVPPDTTVVGVPGKVIKIRPEGWHLA